MKMLEKTSKKDIEIIGWKYMYNRSIEHILNIRKKDHNRRFFCERSDYVRSNLYTIYVLGKLSKNWNQQTISTKPYKLQNSNVDV